MSIQCENGGDLFPRRSMPIAYTLAGALRLRGTIEACGASKCRVSSVAEGLGGGVATAVFVVASHCVLRREDRAFLLVGFQLEHLADDVLHLLFHPVREGVDEVHALALALDPLLPHGVDALFEL